MATAEHITVRLGSRTKDLSGQRFGSLVADAYLGTRAGRSFWRCLCDCGAIVEKPAKHLLTNHVKSCGCQYRTFGISTQKRKENAALYRVFKHMWGRCTNPNEPNFHCYGGRGISVDVRWKNFDTFVADMGPRPSPYHSIDRYPDQNGPYSPENCRWATRTEQTNNMRRNHLLTFNNETLTIAEWARIIGISPSTLYMRLKHGWPIVQALTQPLAKRGKQDHSLGTL